MSFRARLLIAFGLLALLQAGLFTLLSDQLLRDGLEGEAEARLALAPALMPRVDRSRWASRSGRLELEAALMSLKDTLAVDRATLIFGDGSVIDTQASTMRGPDWWASDGLKQPQGLGHFMVGAPLFEGEDGWHKTLYVVWDIKQGIWLRLEAGSLFLGHVSSVQRRLFKLAGVLLLPSLLMGVFLAFALARRARNLGQQLTAKSTQVSLSGRDEFAQLASQINGLLADLREEKAHSERLASEKLQQARHLAFGVAHELRNPLAGLSLSAELLQRKSREGAPAAELSELAERARSEAQRLERTVARFLDFARTPQLSPGPLDLALAVASAGQGLHPGPQVLGQATAWADPKACELVLGVLLLNASQAAGSQGWVKAELGRSAKKAWVRVTDSGESVAAESRDKLFTPFFTTKKEGLGLGLATAYGLADAMGGRLSLLDDRKTFQLELPCPAS